MRTLRNNEIFESKRDRKRRSMRAFRKLPVVRNSHLHLVKNTRDAESQLKNGTYPGTNNFTEFTFDGLGRPVKIVETTAGSVTSTKQLIWCGSKICEERDASGTVTAQFLPLGEKVGSTNYFYEKDHLGSIVGVVNSSGAEVTSIRYDAWGKPTISGSYIPNFGYAGMYLHQRSGLNITLFRAYSSNLARWLSRDPIGESVGINLYSYAENEPIGSKDPLGTYTFPGKATGYSGWQPGQSLLPGITEGPKAWAKAFSALNAPPGSEECVKNAMQHCVAAVSLTMPNPWPPNINMNFEAGIAIEVAEFNRAILLTGAGVATGNKRMETYWSHSLRESVSPDTARDIINDTLGILYGIISPTDNPLDAAKMCADAAMSECGCQK